MPDTSPDTWVFVRPNGESPVSAEKVKGVTVSVQVSPYDLPIAFRGYYVAERGVFRIEFRYTDLEASERQSIDDRVAVDVGQFSRKLLAIEVAVDRHGIDVVRMALQRVDDALRRLRDREVRASARLNYDAATRTFQGGRQQLEHITVG